MKLKFWTILLVASFIGFGSASFIFKDGFKVSARPVPIKGGGKDIPSTSKHYYVATSTISGKEPQIVVFSFDGSRSLSFWDDSFSFQDEMEKAGKPIRFTYFISGVYFLAPKFKAHYESPDGRRGISTVGFADSVADVSARIQKVNEAVAHGDEIASHVNGHFDGSRWTLAQWQKELKSFNDLIFNVTANNHLSPTSNQLVLKPSDVVGFRAPLLAHNALTFKALVDSGYQYDASLVDLNKEWPRANKDGLWKFPLEIFKFREPKTYTVSMDYNFYQMQTNAHNTLKKNTPEWVANRNQVEKIYLDYFGSQYSGTRVPVYVSNHFNLWNDGVYWEATKDVAREICGKPEVYCVTYREMTKYLKTRPL